MVTHRDITLTDVDSATSKVNSGVAISMQANDISYDVGTFLQVPQIPGKDPAQSSNTLLAYGDSIGFANPTINISGIINLEDYDSTSGAAPTNVISVKFLQQIYKSGHIFKITDIYDDNTTTDIYRISGLTGTFPSETLTTLNVMCTGLSINSNLETLEGAKIIYQIQFTEVRT